MNSTITKSEPLSGYSISGVYVLNQELKQVADDAQLREADEVDITFAWDWRLGQKDLFEVMLGVKADASQRRRYEASVMVVGVFKQVGEVPSVALEDFVSKQAIAILLPYLRQHLATLTMASVAGAFHLPTINVLQLVRGFKPEITTGAKQLAERQGARPEIESKASPPES